MWVSEHGMRLDKHGTCARRRWRRRYAYSLLLQRDDVCLYNDSVRNRWTTAAAPVASPIPRIHAGKRNKLTPPLSPRATANILFNTVPNALVAAPAPPSTRYDATGTSTARPNRVTSNTTTSPDAEHATKQVDVGVHHMTLCT